MRDRFILITKMTGDIPHPFSPFHVIFSCNGIMPDKPEPDFILVPLWDSILEFDLERLRLVQIGDQPWFRNLGYTCCHIVRTENGGLGLATLSEEINIQIWEMKSSCRGVHRWILQKTIQLDGQLSSLRPCIDTRHLLSISILGYDEDTNMITLSKIGRAHV